MLTVTAAVQAALESGDFNFAYLVDLPGPLRITNWFKDVTYDSNVYSSNGILLEVANSGSSDAMKVDQTILSLSNTDQTALGIYGAADYFGQAATVYLALFDDDNVLIPDPIIDFQGTLDGWGVEESTTESVIEVKITSHWAKYNRTAGRFTNDYSQQEHHPGDTFFDYGHEDKSEMRWGMRK